MYYILSIFGVENVETQQSLMTAHAYPLFYACDNA